MGQGLMWRVLQKGNVRNVLTLSSGTVTAQAIGVLAAPVLTRLYLPSEFGAFAIYLNSVMLVSVIACLRYEMTIVLVKQYRTAKTLVVLCILIASGLAVGLWIPLAVYADSIHAMMGLDGENRLLLVLPISVLLVASYKVLSNWVMRRKEYGVLAVSKLWQSIPQTVGQLSFGLLHFGVWGLVIGEIVGRLFGVLVLASKSREMFPIQISLGLQRVAALLSYYRHYPLYSSWSALINEAGSVTPVFFLAMLYGPGTAGFYALVQRAFALPMDLVGQTALTMYVAEAAQAIRTNPGALYGLFMKTFLWLLAIAVVPVGLLLWCGPQLFGVVFGREWDMAGVYAQIMAAAYGVRLAVSPLLQTLQMLGKQKFVLVVETTRFLGIVGNFGAGYLLKADVETVLLGHAGVLIAFYACMWMAAWKAARGVTA